MPLEYALQREGLPVNAWVATPDRPLKNTVDIGLEALPAQAIRAARKNGYTFNIMVAGESGLGKTTFLNTLFGDNLVPNEEMTLADRSTKTIRANTFNLTENGVDLKVTTVDTPGFGIHLDRTTGLQPVIEYVDQQLRTHMSHEETTSFRKAATDTLVHVCLYFISPTGHSLTELDVLAMKSLAEKVNLIPVIGKADTLTRDELSNFRARLLQQIRGADIKIYPRSTTFVDETNVDEYEKYTPFALVGSNTVLKMPDGRIVRARQYRWGVAEVENPEHSDFGRLRELIIRSNLNDLVEVTHAVHYERFRADHLQSQGRADPILKSDKDYEERLQLELKQLAHDVAVREDKMKKLFERKLVDKDEELRQREAQITKQRETYLKEIDDERKQLLADIAEADRKLRELNSGGASGSSDVAGSSSGETAGDKKEKKKGILGSSSLMRSKKP